MMGRPANSRRTDDTAFTLIELLIVIATVAVLVAVLLPCLRIARATAKRMACSSRLRQIGTAWFLYLNDSSGRFYQGINANVKFGGWPGLMGYLPRPLNCYVELEPEPTETRAGVFRCPADRGGIPDPDLLYEQVYRINGNSYQANPFLIGQNRVHDFTDDPAYWDVVRDHMACTTIDEVGSPTRVLLAGDYGWFNQWNPLVLNPQELAEWHGRDDSFSSLFVDGHTAYVRIEKGAIVSEQLAIMPFKDLWTWRSQP